MSAARSSGHRSRSFWSGSDAGVEAEDLEQGGEELRLDGADRDLLAVGAAVHVVEGRAGVEQVRAALVGPEARSALAPKNGAMSSAVPSTIAASTTWPSPVRSAWSSPATSPRASSIPPPPKSATRLSGGVGSWPARPMWASAPATAA